MSDQPDLGGSSDQAIPTPEADAPEDAQRDAMDELDRIHQAAGFDAPFLQGSLDHSYGMTSPTGSFSPLDEPEMHRRSPEPALPSARELRSLDDLYATYPKIGDGDYFLRISRKHPTRFGGRFVAGYLTDLHEQISMAEFARRFGGQVYEVSVCGPGRGTNYDDDGRVQRRTLTTITIKCPGPPMLDPDILGGGNGGGGPTMPVAGWGEDTRVTLKRMEHNENALRREQQRNEALQRRLENRHALSPDILSKLDELAEKRVGDSKHVYAEIITELREGKRRVEEALREREALIDNLRQQLVHTQTDVQQRLREEETRQVKELKLKQEQDIARIKDDHAATIQRQQQDHERRINEMTERQSRDMQQLRDTESRDRERMRDDFTRREQGLRDDFDRRERSFQERERQLREDYDRREESARRDYEMRFQQMERSYKRDVEMIRTSEQNNARLVQSTAEMQASLAHQEIQRLSSAVESAESRADQTQRELNRHTNKPLLQQVEETKTIAETLGLLDKKEEDFDWKKGAVSALKHLIDKGEDIARGLGHAREQNRVAVERARVHAQEAQVRANMQRARQLAGAPPPSSMTNQSSASHARHIAPPPPPPGVQGWGAGPAGPGDPGGLPPEPSGPPVVEPVRSIPRQDAGKTHVPAPPPFTGGQPPSNVNADMVNRSPSVEQSSTTQSPAMHSAPTAAVPPSHVAGPSAEPGATDAGPSIGVTEEQIEKFSQQLEEAIASGIVSESLFAGGFIDEVGPEVALKVISIVTPESLVQAVIHHGGGASPIVTRSGRKFLAELWREVQAQATARLSRS